MIKAIFFDFDGVIAESVDIKTRAFAKLFEKENPDAVQKIVDYHLNNAGVSRFDKFGYYYKEILHRPLSDEEFNNLCKQFEDIVTDEVIKAPFVKGAKEFLEDHASVYKCFVVSATPQKEIELIIKRKGLEKYFKAVYGAPVKKTDAVKILLLKENMKPHEALYIGDALSDYNAARDNQVHFIARMYNNDHIFTGIDCIKIKDLTALNDIIKKTYFNQAMRLHIALSTTNITRIRKIFSRQDSIKCLYLGENLFSKRLLTGKLGNKFDFIHTYGLYDDITADIRLHFVQWIDELNRRYGQNLVWWFGNISSRNIYSSRLYQNICYLEILDRIAKKSEAFPKLIIVESPGLAKAIYRWASNKDYSASIEGLSAQYEVLLNYCICFAEWGKYIVVLFMRFIAAFISKMKYKRKNVNDTTIIVDTFVHEYSLTKKGIFHDYYLPYLHEFLLSKGEKVSIHPDLYGFGYNFFSIYERMRKSTSNFLIQEDFLKISDYVFSVFSPVWLVFQKIDVGMFRHYNISDLLIEEQQKPSVASTIQALLIYRLFLRLGKDKINPRIIIDWYENQVIDKALVLGARQALPQTKIIGAQIFIHSPNQLNLYPSQSEIEAQITPQVILTTSQHQCQAVRFFTKDIICRPAAALRYTHLFDELNVKSIALKCPSIVMLLPHNLMEAVELLEIFKEILDKVEHNVSIFIKCHRDYSSEALITAFGKKDWSDRFEIFNGQLPEVLSYASVAISSNSSSMVEAVSKGIPLIFLGRQTTFSINTLVDIDLPIITKCYSSGEVLAALQKYLHLSEAQRNEFKQMGIKIRDLYFEPINNNSMLPFIDEGVCH